VLLALVIRHRRAKRVSLNTRPTEATQGSTEATQE
jgi:hypothetical protein